MASAVYLVDGGLQAGHGLLEFPAGCAHVEAHVAVAGYAVDLAVVEGEFGAVGEEPQQLGVVQSQTAAVRVNQR